MGISMKMRMLTTVIVMRINFAGVDDDVANDYDYVDDDDVLLQQSIPAEFGREQLQLSLISCWRVLFRRCCFGGFCLGGAAFPVQSPAILA